MNNPSSEEDIDYSALYEDTIPSQYVDYATLLEDHQEFRHLADNMLKATSSIRKKRSRPKLPFCTMNIHLVSLHPDLVNEPYSTVDTGARPDVYSTRPFFHFYISDGSVSAAVGQQSFCHAGSALGKFFCDITVVDVYDTYGLEMAYSYCHHLYHSELSIEHPEWLATYLTSSLAILQPQFAREIYDKMSSRHMRTLSLLACSSLLAELVLLESTQPKLLHDIVQHTTLLPIDILAKICNSKRISKDIAAAVTKQRACLPMRLGENHYRARESPVYKITTPTGLDFLQRTITEESIDRHWLLNFNTNSIYIGSQSHSVSSSNKKTDIFTSYRDRARVCGFSELAMLQAMQRTKVTKDNLVQVCTWILFLASDLKWPSQQIEHSSLQDVLERLVEEAKLNLA